MDQEEAEHGADDIASSAEDAGSTDDDGSDDVEFEPGAGVCLRGVEAGDIDDGYETREETVLHVRRETAEITVEPDDFVVTMAQPLANLAIYLLEPQSDDGLARWGHFDACIPGDVFPIVRIPSEAFMRAPARRKVE